MKILYHHRVASKDGQYVHIDELTEALSTLGHEIRMVCPAVAEKSDFGSEGRWVPHLKKLVPQALYELLELSYSIVAFVKLSLAIIRFRPDCIYERYNLHMLAGVWARKLFGLPMILEINAPLVDERKKYDGIALVRLARWSERVTWRSADHVLPVTGVLARKVMSEGVPSSRITVIHNGINPDRFAGFKPVDELRQQLGLGERLVLGFTGFVRSWHRLDKVFSLLGEGADGTARHLLLVGDGPARDELLQCATDLGVSDYLTITGVISRDRIAEYVSTFDIALQPDVVSYASPLKIFEYLALGLPIVAPDVENIREILDDGENAILFSQEDNDAFVDAIAGLCADSTLREQLSLNAKATIRRRGFTWGQNAKQVENLFFELGVRK